MTFSLVVICKISQVLLTTPFCYRGVTQNTSHRKYVYFWEKTTLLLVSGINSNCRGQKTFLPSWQSQFIILQGFPYIKRTKLCLFYAQSHQKVALQVQYYCVHKSKCITSLNIKNVCLNHYIIVSSKLITRP